MQFRYLVSILFIILGSCIASAQQGSFMPVDPFQASGQKTTPDTTAVPPGMIENAVLFEKEPRSHLVDVIMDRWAECCDPEIPIAYWQAGPTAKGEKPETAPKKKAWYEKLGIRGYAQLRYNFTIDERDGSAPAQYTADSSVGDNKSFLLRRARLIIFGDVSEHLGLYLQPDFASTPNGSVDNIQFAQIRDWYGDWYLDKEKVFRFRLGQSKVPYGWENMQSSSNRLALDRSDPINSSVKNERDLGIFFYWTPEYAQKFFIDVIEQGLKGSGNYGVFALGVYNGQGGSLAETNDNLHSVIRLTLPHQLSNGQYVEASVQAYSGFYTVYSAQIRANGAGPLIRPAGTLETGNRQGWLDQRIAGTFVWYPQPIGIQAEWMAGEGPALNETQTAIENRPVNGGYVQAMYKYDTCNHGILFPFIRWQYYRGGYKSERNAPYARVDEWEAGLEWQINPQVELVTMYTLTDRTNTTAYTDAGVQSYQQFEGQLLRVQLQFNY